MMLSYKVEQHAWQMRVKGSALRAEELVVCQGSQPALGWHLAHATLQDMSIHQTTIWGRWVNWLAFFGQSMPQPNFRFFMTPKSSVFNPSNELS
jgi:hypothetical protein